MRHMDEGGRLDLPRRVVLISLGASALAMWPARLRAASDRAPDRSPRVADAATAGDVARAVLYEEDPGEPKGKRFAGDVRWSFDIRSSGGNEAPDAMVHAGIAIPDPQLTLNLTLRRNFDRALPAGH